MTKKLYPLLILLFAYSGALAQFVGFSKIEIDYDADNCLIKSFSATMMVMQQPLPAFNLQIAPFPVEDGTGPEKITILEDHPPVVIGESVELEVSNIDLTQSKGMKKGADYRLFPDVSIDGALVSIQSDLTTITYNCESTTTSTSDIEENQMAYSWQNGELMLRNILNSPVSWQLTNLAGQQIANGQLGAQGQQMVSDLGGRQILILSYHSKNLANSRVVKIHTY